MYVYVYMTHTYICIYDTHPGAGGWGRNGLRGGTSPTHPPRDKREKKFFLFVLRLRKKKGREKKEGNMNKK